MRDALHALAASVCLVGTAGDGATVTTDDGPETTPAPTDTDDYAVRRYELDDRGVRSVVVSSRPPGDDG